MKQGRNIMIRYSLNKIWVAGIIFVICMIVQVTFKYRRKPMHTTGSVTVPQFTRMYTSQTAHQSDSTKQTAGGNQSSLVPENETSLLHRSVSASLPDANQLLRHTSEQLAQPDIVIYNRVHKCGSNTLLAYIEQLKTRHGFYQHHSMQFHSRRLGRYMQVRAGASSSSRHLGRSYRCVWLHSRVFGRETQLCVTCA